MKDLPPEICQLEATAGEGWTQQELKLYCECLASQKWEVYGVVKKVLPMDAADHRAGVIAEFLDKRLEPVLRAYKPGFNGIWPWVAFCLRRHCRDEVQILRSERLKTQPLFLAEKAPDAPDPEGPRPGDIPEYLLDKELHRLTQQAILSLGSKYREPLLLRIRGVTYDDIGRFLGITTNWQEYV